MMKKLIALLWLVLLATISAPSLLAGDTTNNPFVDYIETGKGGKSFFFIDKINKGGRSLFLPDTSTLDTLADKGLKHQSISSNLVQAPEDCNTVGSISIIDINPPEGTILEIGNTYTFELTVNYDLGTNTSGKIGVNANDSTTYKNLDDQTQQGTTVNTQSGTDTVSVTTKISLNGQPVQGVRVWAALFPPGYSCTRINDYIYYNTTSSHVYPSPTPSPVISPVTSLTPPPTPSPNPTANPTLTSTPIPTVITGSATNVTSNSATLNGMVNPNGLSFDVLFVYHDGGYFRSSSSRQNVSGTSDIPISIDISGLSEETTYYYKIATFANWSPIFGDEMTFTTGSVTTPISTPTIPQITYTPTPISSPAPGPTPAVSPTPTPSPSVSPTPWPNSALKAHYTLDEGMGTTANDSSGNANNGVIRGTTWTTGRSGGALSFDGVDDCVDLGNPSSLQPGVISVSAWFKTTATGGMIVRKRTSGYGLEILPTGQISFWIYSNGKISATSPNVYNDDTWHHAVGVYDGFSMITLYIDGSMVASDKKYDGGIQPQVTGISYGLGGGIAIGRDGDYDGSYFNGLIDDVRVYSHGLSAQEVSDIYNLFSPPPIVTPTPTPLITTPSPAVSSSPAPTPKPSPTAVLGGTPSPIPIITPVLSPVPSPISHVTYVSGPITNNTFWDRHGSPYIITGDITINPGVTLLIKSGVEVRFDGNYEIAVNGALKVQGTKEDPISFTTNTVATAGAWKGIAFIDTSDDVNCIIDYATIEYAGTGIKIHHASPSIRHITIENNGTGIYAEHGSSPTITDNTIRNNTMYGLHLYGSSSEYPSPTLTNNDIYDNGSYDVYAASSNNASSVTVNAANNWWGTTNGTEILGNIYDMNDNGNSPKVDYIPFLNGSGAMRRQAVICMVILRRIQR